MKPRVLAIGEVLWDIIRGQEHIGGAPFNLVAHLSWLGCRASILTRIGTDPRGRSAIAEMRRLGVDTSLVQVDSEHPTGWAIVELTPDGVPTFSFPDDPAYNFIEADDDMIHRLIDAMYPLGKMLEFLALQKVRVRDVVETLPPYHIAQRRVACPWDMKGTVMRLLNDEYRDQIVEQVDGVKIRLDTDQWVLVVPEPDEAVFTIVTEAESQQAAAALADRYVRVIEGMRS